MEASDHKLSFSPNRRAFISVRLWRATLVFLLLSAAALVAAYLLGWFIAWLIVPAAASWVYSWIDAVVSLKKQRYEFGKDAVYFNDGHLFSDRKTELRFDRITHVRVIKPFVENRIFGTGKVLIEAAGSKEVAVQLSSIDQPYVAFERIRALLAEETFSISYQQLLSKQKPSPLAVILQGVGTAIGGIFFLMAATGFSLLTIIIDGLSSFTFVWLLMLVAVTVIITVLYVSYQDQIRRVYYVYSDVIHYSKGFLTRQEAFMPAANLANTELTQNFISKLLDLQNVIVSCQGQGSQINFANIRGGHDMQQAVNQLINNRKLLLKTTSPGAVPELGEAENETSDSGTNLAANLLAKPTPQIDDVSAQDFYMNTTRAIVPILPLLVVPPIFVIALIARYIAVKRTVFRLSGGGVASYYSFLTTKNVELSRDKITGLVIKRNPLDRYFNTCTAEFWSIGSGTVVSLKHISMSAGLIDTMRVKAGIVDDDELALIKPQFTFTRLIKANLAVSLLLAAVFAADIAFAAIVSWWLLTIDVLMVLAIAISLLILNRRYHRATLRLGQHTTSMQIGIMLHKHYWTLNDNIKDITLTKYPWSTKGTVMFNVAGERADPSRRNGRELMANYFAVPYVPAVAAEVSGQTTYFDQLLLLKPSREDYQTVTKARPSPMIYASRPALKNSLAAMIPVFVIVFPLLIILPLAVLARWYWLRRVSYRLESDRIVKRWGVVYRKQTSILLGKLDYTETGQNFLNKLCKNGNIYLYAAGSSQVELELVNLPDYQEFHSRLTV